VKKIPKFKLPPLPRILTIISNIALTNQ
jgi:hypothetical protein